MVSFSNNHSEPTLPGRPQLVDNHIHTNMAYCSENMTVPDAVARAHQAGLAGITFTEHAGQLYFDCKSYWRNEWLKAGVEGTGDADSRMSAYLELKRMYEDDFARFTLEVEVDVRGNLLLRSEDRHHFDWLLGTIHGLSGLTKETPPQQSDLDEFLFLIDAMGKQGVRVLAHPLRVFSRAGWEKPVELFEPTAQLLSTHGMAAEINFHTNEPPVDFVRCCLAHGVSFSFGSDAHNLDEVGDFKRHIALLAEAGFEGDLSDVVLGRI